MLGLKQDWELEAPERCLALEDAPVRLPHDGLNLRRGRHCAVHVMLEQGFQLGTAFRIPVLFGRDPGPVHHRERIGEFGNRGQVFDGWKRF